MTAPTPISRAAVLEILRTPAASDTFPDMIRRVEALEPVAQPEPGAGELLPCPFCGGGNVRVDVGLAEFHDGEVTCLDCGGNCGNHPTKGEAIAAWNRRAAREPGTEPTHGQFTTMCLMIEDVITGRGFDVDPWQPIETAPKDMTEVIVLCGHKDIRLGWYFAPSSQTFGWKDQRGKNIKPTHWLPLSWPGETTSAIPEAVKAYLRNVLMVGGWRGE